MKLVTLTSLSETPVLVSIFTSLIFLDLQAVSTAQEQFNKNSTVQPKESSFAVTEAKGKPPTAKVNFSIGDVHDRKFYHETSNQAAFDSQKNSTQGRERVDVPNLRSANFSVGNQKLDYSTTTKQIQSEVQKQGETINVHQMKMDQRERMIRARSAQFQYGIDKQDYSTSVGANFVKHELGGSVAQAKIERQNNGKELRQSHFLVGTDN